MPTYSSQKARDDDDGNGAVPPPSEAALSRLSLPGAQEPYAAERPRQGGTGGGYSFVTQRWRWVPQNGLALTCTIYERHQLALFRASSAASAKSVGMKHRCLFNAVIRLGLQHRPPARSDLDRLDGVVDTEYRSIAYLPSLGAAPLARSPRSFLRIISLRTH